MNANERGPGETAVTLAALLHLIRLMGAELVAGQHRDDVELLVKAIDTKLTSVQLPTNTVASDVVNGMELARRLIAPILDDLRAKSEKAHLRDRLLAAPTSRIQ